MDYVATPGPFACQLNRQEAYKINLALVRRLHAKAEQGMLRDILTVFFIISAPKIFSHPQAGPAD